MEAGNRIATVNHTSGEFAVGYPHQRKVIRDASGYWYVVYMDYNSSTSKYEIYLAKSTNTSGTGWATPVKVAGQGGIVYNESTYDFRYPTIEVNSARSSIHLAFNKVLTLDSGTDDHVVYTQCGTLTNWNSTVGWTSASGGTSPRYDALATTSWASATPKYAPTLGVDSTGQVHVLFTYRSGTTYTVYYSKYAAGSWNQTSLSSSTLERAYPTIEIRSNNWIYCAWTLYSSTYAGFTRVEYTYYNTGDASPAWSTPTYVILQNGTGVDLRYVSMAADDEGNVHLAVEQDGTGSYPPGSVWGAYFNGTSWATFQSSTPIDTLGWDKPAVGVTLGAGVTNDIIVAPRDGGDPDAVYRWKWGGSSWAQYEASTLESSDSFAALEKRAPAGSTSLGLVTFDAGGGTGDIYFSRVRHSDTQTTISVAATTDDATEGYNTSNGYMWLNGAVDRNRATTTPTLVRDTGVRFTNVTIPAGATVTGAFFEAYFYDDNSGDGLPPLDDDIDCTIYAHATDNSPTFTSTAFNITDTAQRPRTSASASWQKDELAGNYSGAAAWGGIHVAPLVQEVVDRAGWASGNAVSLVFIRNPAPSVTKSALWRSRDYGSNYPKLTITYTTLGAELDSHPSGQVSDQLLGDASQSDVNLFRFQILNDRPSPTTVGQMQFQLSGVSGIATGDISDIRISDGTSYVATGGVASISGATGTITFTNWVLPAGPLAKEYTLVADLAGLLPTEALTVALGTSNVTLSPGSLPVGGNTPGNATHTVDYPALLKEHSSGQATDQFDSAPAKNDVTLFRFKLTNTLASAVTVDQVQFQLSSVTGIVGPDLTDLRVVPEGGGTVGGSASVSIASGSGTVTFASDFAMSSFATVNYELVGDASNLGSGDAMTLSLGISNVTLTSGTTGGMAPADVTHTWNPPVVSASADDSYSTQSSDNASSNIGATLIQVVSYFGTSTQSHGGLRFPGIHVPQGSTVSSASLWVYVDGTANDDPRLVIHGEDTGNALDFDVAPGGNPSIATRPRIATRLGGLYQTSWSADAVGQGWKQLDVTKIVEGIVGRGDWASGNALALLLVGGTNNPAYRVYLRSWDNDTNHTYAPYLAITYTPPTTLVLGNHGGGQALDQFDGNLAQNDRELFRFRLTNTTGGTVTIDQIVFPLSTVAGIASGDLSDLRIREGGADVATGGVASVAAGSGTISFTNDWTIGSGTTLDYLLYGDVANLQYPDSLTLSLGSANVTPAAGDVGGSVSASATHTADYAATLASHGSGQIADQLGGAPSQADRALFRFRLVNTTATALTVDQVVLQLSAVSGVAAADLASLRIHNGTIDVTTGGVASIAAGSGTITFTGDFTLPASATVDYTVFGDVANVVKNDTLTMALGAANVTLLAGSVGGTAPANVTHTGDDAASLGSHASGQAPDAFDAAPSKDNAALFRFQLVNTTAVDLTVDQLQFQLSAITGLVTSDLSDLRLNNGSSDVATGGTTSIAGATGTITFTGDFTLPASATVNYTLLGDAANLANGDTITLALGTPNVTLAAGSLGGTAPANVVHAWNWPRVSASADDAYVVEGTDNATSYLASTPIALSASNTASSRQHGGFRIPGVYIPPGATINSATLNVYITDGNDDPRADVYGHLTLNAPDFGTVPQILGRTPTAATTYWNADNLGTGWKTINVQTILHALVNQAGWQSGNATAFLLIERSSSGIRCNIDAWDLSAGANAAYLTYTYTPPTTIVLGNYSPGGQIADQFDGGVAQDSKPLYRFQITNTTGSAVTVDQIVFPLSAITGIADTDLANLRINDGSVDVATGGVPAIAGATGTITFGANWTIPANSTRNYSVVGGVANLAVGDTLTLGLGTGNVTLVSGDVGGSVSSTATHTADHTVFLTQHGLGQLTDQLDGSPSRTSVPLFRFRLTNNSQSTVTVDQVVLPLSGVAGLVNGDVSGLRIHDGTTDVSVGGTPAISGATGTLTFDADFTLAAAATVDYTVYADLASLVKDDGLTLALATGNVSLAAGSVSGSAPSNATHAVDYSLLLAQHGSGQMTDQFDSSTTKTGVSLFRFQVQNTTPVPIMVTQVQFPLSAVSGIAAGDTANMVLFNGSVNVGGAGVVSIGAGAGTITFSSSFAIPASTTVSYTLIGDVANLYAGDTMTIALGLANVTLQAGTIGGSAPSSVAHTADAVVFQVSASDDDSYADDANDNASTYRASTFVSVRTYQDGSSSKYNGGLRFAGVTIPQGAIINSATLSGYVYDALYDDIDLTVKGHAVDSAPNFLTNRYIRDQAQRPRTSSGSPWLSLAAGTGWKNVDVTDVVQDIVSRSNWTSGNPLALLLISTTQASNLYTVRFRSYDGNPTEAAKLIIDYSPPFLVKSHPSGQLADQLDGAPSRDDAPVFRFQLFNGTGNDITIDQVVLPLSGIAGVVGTDLTDLKLHDESGYVGGVGAAAITGATGTITFTGDFTVTAGQTKNYTLYADLANLVKNDTLTVSFAPGNVTVLAGDVGGVSPANATHLVDHTLVLGAHASGQVTDQFDGGLSQAGIDLFRFQLDSDSLSDTTVNQVAVQLSAVTGIVAGDLANLRLHNGTADVGGTPAVSIVAGTGTITFSTPFAVTANTVVNYRLIGDVANLASGDTLTFSLGTAHVTLAAGTVGGSAPSNATHTADPTVLLGSHASGQVADQFDGSLSQAGRTLFRFRLTNNSTSTKTVNQLAFPLSAVTGIGAGDLSALRVWNGTADVGGTASVDIAAGTGTITFSAPFNLAASAVVDYELIADAAGLVSGDTLTIGLGTANVTLAAGTTGGTPPSTATHTADHTALLAQHASGQVTDQWDTQATQTGKTLFRFRLSNNSGSTITVDQVQLQLAPVVGIVSGDLTGLKITDGAVDVSTGGTPSIAGATGTITFAADFTLAAGQTKDYVVVGSAANLEQLDAITVALGTANVTLAAGSVGGTAPSSIMHRTDPPSVDGEITDTNDDAWEDPGSSPDVTYRTSSTLTVTTSTNALSRAHAGFRFQNLQVLKDAVVNRAVLSVYMTDVANDHLIATVYGDDTSASPNFATAIDINGSDNTPLRTLTTASAALNQPNYGAGWKRIDVTAIAQELVTRADWAAGGPMTFLMLGGTVNSSTGASAWIEDLSAAGTNHARLAIDFNNAALIGSHRWGQVADQFEATTGVFDRPLFQFQLRNVKGTTINIGQVVFQLTGVVGITNGDVANLRLNNGTADLGTCSASIDGGTGTITCTPGIAIATDGVRHLSLLGDVFNLAAGDTLTIALAPTDVVVAEGPVGRYLPLAPAVTHAWGARSPLVGYSDYAASGPRPLRFSSFEGNVWTLAASAVNGPFDTQGMTGPWPLHWKRALTLPGLGKQVVLFQEADADKTSLWGSVWNGTSWDDGAGAPLGDAHEVAGYGVDPGMLWNNLKQWDAAYEQLSGDLVIASGINTDENILWWRHDGTTWSDYQLEQFGNNIQDEANLFDWVHLSPMPRTNRIAFVGIGNDYPDANSAAIHGAIWDGDNDTWIQSSKAILSFPTGNTQSYHSTDAADVKFTLGGQNHGEAVAVWGNKQYVYASVWNETTGWSSNKTVANFGANKTVRWVRLEANPKSDDMIVAIAYQDGSNTNGILATVAYDGTARTFAASPVQHTTDLYGDVTKNRPFDLSWDPLSGPNDAILAYSVGSPVGGSNLLYARTSSGGVGWNSANGISAHQAHWVQLEREPRHDLKIRLAIQTDELRVWSWDSFSWLEETSSAISLGTEYGTNHEIEPMALAEAPLWGEPASGTTPVRLASFTAAPYDAAVLLEWETASELDNLGFHLYRGASADGPWARLTASLIPGLGSSPEGRAYRYVDSGLENGTTYFYRLEDVDRKGVATAHGPVSATPVAGESVPGEPPPPPGPAPLPGGAWVSHGNPAEVELKVLERTEEGVTFELLTGGFYAQEQADGTSRLHVPGFFSRIEPGLPSVPTKRLWTEATVGRGVRLVSVTPEQREVFTGLRPAIAGAPTAVAAADGTYQAAFRPVRPASLGRGLYPAEPAQVLGTAFQGEAKMAHVELSPLRVDAAGRVILARRLVVRVAFDGAVAGETGERSSGRRPLPAADGAGTPLARFATRARGLHAVAFEDVPGTGGSAVPLAGLRLTRLGTQVAFHVEPRTGAFGPGSLLYFVAGGTDTAHGREAVYELARAADGVRMAVDVAAARGGAPAAPAVTHLRHEAAFEQDVNYLPALLESRDLWTWDYGLAGGQSASYAFKIQDLTLVPEAARLVVDLEGGSDTVTDPDHHVRVFVNGSLVGEATWDGMRPATVEVDVPVAVLRPGDNALFLENAGDTGSAQSFVYLDRFTIEYPREIVPVDGVVEGVAPSSGRVGREAAPGTVLLDVTAPAPAWLGRVHALGQAGFRAEAGHRYLMVAPEAVQRPEVRPAPATTLRGASNQADWLLIGPRDLLPAAEPLVAHRQAQGLAARAVALEDVVDEFGHGESGPHAVRSFLAFAFQGWARPSVRYVVLLGDATYDPKGRLTGTSRPDTLPTPLTRSTFLWTASDPLYAATNGEDLLPDLAVGRLSAATLAEAQAAVQKILDFETAGLVLDGKAVLVADNPDSAGDFEANQDDVASILGSRPVERIYLGQSASPATAKAAVMAAFNGGASLVSYVGHGSSGLWATEGLLRSPDVAALAPQPRQPLVLTMTCSNGYFVSPYSNSLSERLALTAGKGAIAVFSPSGLSLNDAAHVYHRALARELEGGSHERLGDLVLAAQAAYAQTGAFPELLAIYHLFGDPGLKVR